MKKICWMVALLGAISSPVWAQFGIGAAPADIEKARAKWPGLGFEISTPRTSYALGEAIPITMRYRNDGKPGLRVWVVTYDRSGRIMDFGFGGRDAQGHQVRDPFPFQGGMFGGLRTQKGLGQYEQTVSLNEWLSFDRPGHYTITSWSSIVEEAGPEGTYGTHIPLQSAPLELDISPPDEASRQTRLATARAALDAAEKRAASLPTTQNSYERDEKLGPQVGAAMRDLRWMTDPRAVPLLLRGLELGGSAAFEAHRGLVAFPDLAPVRAAILRRLRTEKPVTENEWAFKDLLARSSPKPQKPGFARLSPEDEALFNRPVRIALARGVASRNAKSAALDAATLLANDARAPAETAVWRAFWLGAASLPENRQWTAALLLLQEKERAKSYPVTISDLRRAARDERLSEELRSAAVVALAARNDFSLRPLLAVDVTAPKTHFTPQAFATLGNFQARPIAQKLLQELRLPDNSSVFAKEELAARLRDFGGGATRAELIEAARWMMVHFPYTQGPLLEAVALRDKQSALVLIRESLAKRPAWEYSDGRLAVLIRLDLPAAREQVRAFLGQNHADFLTSLVGQLAESTHDWVIVKSPGEEGQKHLRAPRELSESVVPEIARLFFHSPSAKVRQTAGSALVEITEVRADQRKPDQMRTALRAWWQKNAGRLGRSASLSDGF